MTTTAVRTDTLQPRPRHPGITEDDIVRYEQDGAICLRQLFAEAWLERLREATARSIATTATTMNIAGETGRFSGDIFMWMKDSDFRAFALESPAALIAQTLMRSTTVRFFADQLFVKEPGTQSPTPWHHDQTYWPVTGDSVCSVWLALDPVTIETSGIEYVAGSHRWGQRFPAQDFNEASVAMLRTEAEKDPMPDIDADRSKHRFLSWDMQAGDCLVHHSLAVHGAKGNHSVSQRRRALSTRWFGDSARFLPRGPLNEALTGLKPGDPMNADHLWPLVDTASLAR